MTITRNVVALAVVLGCGVPNGKVTVKATGLCSAVNTMATPEGALARADNVTIGRDNIIETRRGFDILATEPFKRIFPYQGGLIGWREGGPVGTLYWSEDGVSWAQTQPFINFPTSTRAPRTAEAASQLYLTTPYGVSRLDGLASTAIAAGAPRAPAPDAGSSIFVSPAGPFHVGDSVAYRVVLCRKDSKGRLIQGAPSGRTVATANWDNRSMLVSLYGVAGYSESFIAQLYRSETVTNGAPSDNLQLVSETTLPGWATATTRTRSGGVTTYTTSAAHGFIPGDLVQLKGAIAGFPSDTGASVTSVTSTTFTISDAGADATQAGNQTVMLIIRAVSDVIEDELRQADLYTNETQQGPTQGNDLPPLARDVAAFRGSLVFADTAGEYDARLSLLATGGTRGLQSGDTVTAGGITITAGTDFNVETLLTPSQNIFFTASSLVAIFNGEFIGAQKAAVAAYTSAPDDPPGKILFYSTAPGQDTIGTVSSSRTTAWMAMPVVATADTFRNGLRWSKKDEPDHVPATNSSRVASADREILRVIPTRDSVFILKREDGVFRLTGDSPETFRVDPFDYNTHLVAPETARALDNKIFMLTEQGVVALTDTGVELVSRTADGRGIEDILRPLLVGAMKDLTESLAFAVTSESDRKYILALPTVSTDTLCTQAYAYDLITQAWTRWDLTAAYAISNPTDDCLYLVDGVHVFRERKTFTDADFTEDAGQIVESVEWMPQFAQPGMLHEFTSVVLSLRRPGFTGASLSFATDLDPSWETVALDPLTAEYGTVRVLVPRDKARGSVLRVRWDKTSASRPTQIQALTVYYVPGSTLVAP